MAVEDGIVFAECISRATIPQAIPAYLSAFVSIRKERTYAVQTGSVKNTDFWPWKIAQDNVLAMQL